MEWHKGHYSSREKFGANELASHWRSPARLRGPSTIRCCRDNGQPASGPLNCHITGATEVYQQTRSPIREKCEGHRESTICADVAGVGSCAKTPDIVVVVQVRGKAPDKPAKCSVNSRRQGRAECGQVRLQTQCTLHDPTQSKRTPQRKPALHKPKIVDLEGSMRIWSVLKMEVSKTQEAGLNEMKSGNGSHNGGSFPPGPNGLRVGLASIKRASLLNRAGSGCCNGRRPPVWPLLARPTN